ncbi:MAG: hypothetical protein AAF152_19360 [Cyanobacteria bacterium P01_A01_bin.114]
MKKKHNVLTSIYRDPKLRRYLLMCGMVTVGVIVAQLFLVGSIYGEAEAIELLEGFRSSSLYFGSAIAKSSITVLALMLTLLSVAKKSDADFDRSVYRGIEVIGLISTISFVGAVLLLLCLSLPVGEFDNVPSSWFKGLYYGLSALNGCLSGLMIAGVLILFDTIKLLIRKLSL